MRFASSLTLFGTALLTLTSLTLTSAMDMTCPSGDAQIVFLIPESTTIGSASFAAIQAGVSGVVTTLSHGNSSTVQIGVVGYSALTETLPVTTDANAVVDFIQHLAQSFGNNVVTGMEDVGAIWDPSSRAPRIVVIIASSGPTVNGGSAAAMSLKRQGATIYTIDIGGQALSEVSALSSVPRHLFALTPSTTEEFSSSAAPQITASLLNRLYPSDVNPVTPSCTIFGASNIVTPSGTAYTFPGFGEFTLLKSTTADDGFTVEVRKLDCKFLTEDTATDGVTCVRGFVVSDGSDTVDFEYFSTHNRLTWRANGAAQSHYSTSTTVGAFQISILPRSFDKQDFSHAFDITVTSSVGHRVTAVFGDRGSAVTVTPATSLLGGSSMAGLCGIGNGCAGADIAFSNGSLAMLSEDYSDADLYSVGMSYAVHYQESLFSNILLESFAQPESFSPVFNTESSSATGFECGGTSGFGRKACSYDTKHINSFTGQFAAVEVTFAACDAYCRRGGFLSGGIMPESCRCGVEDGFDIHTVFNPQALPPVAVQGSDLSTAFAQVPVGGEYTFRRGAGGELVTVDVHCSGDHPIANAGDNKTVNFHQTEYPLVQLVGFNSGRDLISTDRVSWKFVDYPNTPPEILNPTQLTARFYPTEAGMYVAELAIFDGCQSTFSQVTITVECDSCFIDQISMIDGTEIRLHGNTFTTGYFPVDSAVLNDDGFSFSLGHAVTRPHHTSGDFELRVPGEGHIPFPLSLRSVTPDSPSLEFTLVRITRHYKDISYTHGTEVTAEGETITITPSFNDLDQTIQPAQTFAHFETDSTVTTIASRQDTVSNHTFVSEAVEDWCSVTLSFVNTILESETVIAAEVSVQPASSRPASACEAVYSLLTSYDNECGSSAEPIVAPFTVDCGPRPVARTNCSDYEAVFNKNSGRYEQVTLIGRQSFQWDLDAPIMEYTWNLTSAPDMSSFEPHVIATTKDPTFRPDIEGKYDFLLQVTDGCSISTAPVSIVATCPEKLQVNFTAIPTVPIVPFSNPSVLQTVRTSASVSNTQGNVRYSWSAMSTRTDLEDLHVPLPVINGQFTKAINFVPTICGPWTVNVTVVDSCSASSFTQDFDVTCSTVDIVAASFPTTIAFDSLSESFAAFVLNATISVKGNSSVPNSQVTWYVVDAPEVQSPTFFPNDHSRTTNMTVFGPGEYTVAVVATDNIQYSSKMVTVHATCHSIFISSSPSKPTAGQLISLTARHATTALWLLTERPVGSSATLGDNSTQLDLHFTADISGAYKFALVATNPTCFNDNQFHETFTVTVDCTDPSASGWAPKAQAAVVHHDGSSFPGITLKNTGSYGTLKPSDFTWRWRFLEAPVNSVYLPSTTENLSNTTTTATRTIPAPQLGEGYEITQTINTTENTETVSENWVQFDGDEDFCFYPDLPGTYKVEILMRHSCGFQTTTVPVAAECNGELMVDVATTPKTGVAHLESDVASITIASTPTFNRSTVDHNTVYEWQWDTAPPAGAAVVLYGEGRPTLTIESGSMFSGVMNLTISDGCLSVTKSIPVSFKSTSAHPNHVSVVVASLDYPVIAAHKIVLESPDVPETHQGQTACSEPAMWTLTNYTSNVDTANAPSSGLSGGATAGISIVTIAVVGAAGVCIFCYARKRKEDSDSATGYGASAGASAGAGAGAGAGTGAGYVPPESPLLPDSTTDTDATPTYRATAVSLSGQSEPSSTA